MITFDPLWKTMKEKNVSQYKLVKEYGFSFGQLDRFRKNANVNLLTIDTLCRILDCDISDVVEYKKD